MGAVVGAKPVVESGDIEGFLRRVVEGLEPEPAGLRGRGRPRVLPATALWMGVLVCVLRGFAGQVELWRLLASKRLWEYPRFPIGDEAVRRRLAGAGTGPLERLFARVGELLAPRIEPYAMDRVRLAGFATDVVAIDQITLDGVARLLPALRDLPGEHLLPGAIAGAFDVRGQRWVRVEQIADANQNEKVAARELLEGLPAGTLLLFDLGYFCFRWFDELTDGHYRWVSRLRKGTSYEVIHTHYKDGETEKSSATFDGLVWLGKHRADRAKHAVRVSRAADSRKRRAKARNSAVQTGEEELRVHHECVRSCGAADPRSGAAVRLAVGHKVRSAFR